jgi:hypothetical protein
VAAAVGAKSAKAAAFVHKFAAQAASARAG